MNYERRLNRDRCAGAIFALKSMFGWRDQVEVKVTSPLAGLDICKLPHDLIQRIAEGEPSAAVLLSATAVQLRAARIPEGECEEMDNTGHA